MGWRITKIGPGEYRLFKEPYAPGCLAVLIGLAFFLWWSGTGLMLWYTVFGYPAQQTTASDVLRAKVTHGMTAEQVTAQVGEPPGGKHPTQDQATGKQLEEWRYDGGRVYFDGGRVAAVRALIPYAEVKEKVKVGMTAEQVNAALNSQPTHANQYTGSGGKQYATWSYDAGNISHIYLEDGRVVRLD